MLPKERTWVLAWDTMAYLACSALIYYYNYGAYNNVHVYSMTYTALGAIICWSKNIGDAHKPVKEEMSNQQS